jgi:drug/metabolite transporter (DMT)-like permease
MSWLFFAFCGPVLWAISMHFDKYLVERFFKHANVAVLLVFTALMGLVMLPPIWVFRPDVLAFGFPSILVVIASGLLLMGAMFFYLLALQSEEASVVAPFFQASPLFAYALGYLVLGETLSRVQLIGGALVVGGALILSVRWGEAAKFKLRMVVLMLACAFASALSSLIFKIFAVREEFWATTFWTFVGQAIFGATVLAIRRYRQEFLQLLREATKPLLGINAATELINLGGGLGSRYALVLAPLSLVQAITSTTSLFVFIFGIALSILFPSLGREDLSGRELIRKALGGILIGVGVTLIIR